MADKSDTNKARLTDVDADEHSALRSLPNEILAELASCINNATDFGNFRLINKHFRDVTKHTLGKRIASSTVYPRYDNMKALLEAVQDSEVSKFVLTLDLLAEGLKEHEYGYNWAWEDLQIWDGLTFSRNDVKIINAINAAHADDVVETGNFLTSGQYRVMLTAVLEHLPNLKTITVRKLKLGEQIPGWSGAKLFETLSFYHDRLDTRDIFYGDWQYDSKHLRATYYKDEFGDTISEPGAGPQVSFVDDLRAAVNASGVPVKVSWKQVA